MSLKILEIAAQNKNVNQNDLHVSTERTKPPKGYPTDKELYAIPDKYLFPLDTEAHVRSAIKMVGLHKWVDSDNPKEAAKKIISAAKKYNITITKDDKVYKMAHS